MNMMSKEYSVSKGVSYVEFSTSKGLDIFKLLNSSVVAICFTENVMENIVIYMYNNKTAALIEILSRIKSKKKAELSIYLTC